MRQLRRFLHLSDPMVSLNDKMWCQKLDPISPRIRELFQTYYIPSSNVTVDEMIHGQSHTLRMAQVKQKVLYSQISHLADGSLIVAVWQFDGAAA